MTCPRCGKPMREEKRSFHKNRKWKCPHCGKTRFQKIRKEKNKKAQTGGTIDLRLSLAQQGGRV
ncbi:MAG TPA: hypothetical protein VI546_05540, partial [candidate division Zixibacteria bacterium]|nr:hypothetical protein [candidate division Zixibacteria bacterium]